MSARHRTARNAPKKPRQTTFMLVEDEAAYDAAHEVLAEAERTARYPRMRSDDDSEKISLVEAADKAILDAKKAVRETVRTYTFQAVDEDLIEDLRCDDAHAPTKGQLSRHTREVERAAKAGRDKPLTPQWNDRTFAPALLALCAPDEGMSEAEWAEHTSTWNPAERSEAILTAFDATYSKRTVDLPKG